MICTQVTQISHSTVGSSFSVSFSAGSTPNDFEMLRMMREWFMRWNNSGVSFIKADTPQTEETCERCVYVRGSQWCQGCNGTPKRWDGEKIVDTPQTDCRTCKWAEVSWTSHYCDDCKAHNKYEPNDTPLTDCTRREPNECVDY